MKRKLQASLACLAALAIASFASCRAREGKSEPPPGMKVVERLSGAAVSNQAALVERLRHLPAKSKWERQTFLAQRATGELIYLLYKPVAAMTHGTNLPLVLSLHGGAPRQSFDDLLDPGRNGMPYGLGRLVNDETQEKYPSFVLAPWSGNRNWDDANLRLVIELLDSLASQLPIDTDRIYVTGQSMGGWGTWGMITQNPEKFAAAIPICGGGNPKEAPRARNIPVWAFHGTVDANVPVHRTRDMIYALHNAGGSPRYWEYYGESHSGTAERAYCEPDLMDWLFAQRK